MAKQTDSPPKPGASRTPARQGSSARISPTQAAVRRSQRYERKTATFEGKRDDRPAFLFLGRNLSTVEKARLQRRLYLGFAGFMVALAVFVGIYGYVNFNYIQPGQPITTVNGEQIPQRNFRYMVAFLAQDTWNQLKDTQSQIITLQSDTAPEHQNDNNQKVQALQTVLNSLTTTFTATQIDQLAYDRLVEDSLIRTAMKQYEKTDTTAKAAFTVTNQQVEDAYHGFSKAFPKGESIATFLKKNNISADDIKNMIRVNLRRIAMDNYLQKQYTSPTKQVHYQIITVDNKKQAQQIHDVVVKDPSKWADLSKGTKDPQADTTAGDQGWQAYGQKEQAVERYLFRTDVKPGDVSPVILDTNGTYDVVKVLEVDPARPLDDSTLNSLKSNALAHEITGWRRLAPTNNIADVNQDMFNSSFNNPVTPDYSKAPAPQQGTSNGLTP